MECVNNPHIGHVAAHLRHIFEVEWYTYFCMYRYIYANFRVEKTYIELERLS